MPFQNSVGEYVSTIDVVMVNHESPQLHRNFQHQQHIIWNGVQRSVANTGLGESKSQLAEETNGSNTKATNWNKPF